MEDSTPPGTDTLSTAKKKKLLLDELGEKSWLSDFAAADIERVALGLLGSTS